MARSRKRLSYKKELYYIICIVVLLVVLGFSIFGPGGYRDLQKARLDLQEQRVRVEELKRKNYERMKSIEELRSSRDALEKYAREKGYGKEGEIIQQLPPDPDAEPPKP
jgi:cell division protein FtsB